MLDPVVHAALVTLFVFLLKLLANALGFDLTEDVYTQLAGIIVAYILSLFGYSLWVKATSKVSALAQNRSYRPPFS